MSDKYAWGYKPYEVIKDKLDQIISLLESLNKPGVCNCKSGTLKDYSTSELLAEYMRRDGCG